MTHAMPIRLSLITLMSLPFALPAQEAVRLTQQRDFLQHLSWSPDGQRLLVTRIHLGKMGVWSVASDGSDWKNLVPGLNPSFDASWTPDAKRIVFVYDQLQGTDGKLQIDIMDPDGGNRATLVPHRGAFEESPRFSPDGRWLAWTSTRQKTQDIWLSDGLGKDAKNLTNNPANSNQPAWSPDGKRIAFCSWRSGNQDIWVMNADGSEPKNLTKSPRSDCWPAWSPDGKRIAFTSNRDGNYEIYIMNADGSEPRNLTRSPSQDNYAAWSPDGRKLAFISNRAGGYDIHVLPMD
jgi:TolB protein